MFYTKRDLRVDRLEQKPEKGHRYIVEPGPGQTYDRVWPAKHLFLGVWVKKGKGFRDFKGNFLKARQLEELKRHQILTKAKIAAEELNKALPPQVSSPLIMGNTLGPQSGSSGVGVSPDFRKLSHDLLWNIAHHQEKVRGTVHQILALAVPGRPLTEITRITDEVMRNIRTGPVETIKEETENDQTRGGFLG